MSMTATSSASVTPESGVPARRLVRWPPVVDDIGAFATTSDSQPAIGPTVIARAKQALLDDVRKLVLLGVEPRPDGLHCDPSTASLAIAEQLISSLPDDVTMPSVSLPDDGEITFSWQATDETGEHWRAVLAVAPDSEVECFVRRHRDHQAVVHFQTNDGTVLFGLPDNIETALRTHWRA